MLMFRMSPHRSDLSNSHPREVLPFPFPDMLPFSASSERRRDSAVSQPSQGHSQDENELESRQHTPSALSTNSPSAVGVLEEGNSPTNKGEEPSSGPHRNKKRGAQTAQADEPEKRKRHRVTPEQLAQLEHWFKYKQTSPNAEERRAISQQLGMGERQTQIWFQNRRAKAKQLAQKGIVEPATPNMPPALTSAFEAELHSIINEDKVVTLLPCTDLSVGSWRRIATTGRDLIGYFSGPDKTLTWFIQSGGHAFKMEIHWDHIAGVDFQNVTPGIGNAKFKLRCSPNFFLEAVVRNFNGKPLRLWRRCSDWTENQQASIVMVHEVSGAAMQISNLVDLVNTHRARYSKSLAPQVPLPVPPMASVKANYSPHSPDYANFSSAAYQQVSYPGRTQYANTPALPPQSYPTSRATRSPFPEALPAIQTHPTGQFAHGAPVSYHTHASPSPPILTTPYHPPNSHDGYNANSSASAY